MIQAHTVGGACVAIETSQESLRVSRLQYQFKWTCSDVNNLKLFINSPKHTNTVRMCERCSLVLDLTRLYERLKGDLSNSQDK